MKNIITGILLILLVNIVYSNQVFYGNLTKVELLKTEQAVLLENDGFDRFVKLGYIYHFLSQNGEKFPDKSIDYFNKALQIKNDYNARAYLGSSYTIKGKQSENVFDKINFVNKGTSIMDSVYKDHPDDFQIALLIIANSLELPNIIFGRYKIADEIINKFLKIQNTLSKDDQSDLHYYKGYLYYKNNKKNTAFDIWSKVIKDYPDTNGAKKAKLSLNKEGA